LDAFSLIEGARARKYHPRLGAVLETKKEAPEGAPKNQPLTDKRYQLPANG
jgi:hypothetical protein